MSPRSSDGSVTPANAVRTARCSAPLRDERLFQCSDMRRLGDRVRSGTSTVTRHGVSAGGGGRGTHLGLRLYGLPRLPPGAPLAPRGEADGPSGGPTTPDAARGDRG